MNARHPEVSLIGAVVNKRKVSKKLVFFDLELEGGSITELCIKEGPAFSVTRVKDLRDDVKLGDTVLVTGTTDPGDRHVILPSGISVTTRWKDAHPGKHFVPKCRPKQPLQNEAKELLKAARGEPDGPAELVKGASGRQEDSHAAAVKNEPSLSQQVCKFHINGGCQKGDKCPHLHVDLSAAPRVRKCWIAERKQARRQAAAEKGDPHSGSAAKKGKRAAVFAQWLVDTYGTAFLNSGTGVVDVAGGRGSLSFALQTVHRVNCTVVDPRPPKPTKEQLRFLQQPPCEIACSSDTCGAPRQSRGWAEGSTACPESMADAPGQRTGSAEASAAYPDEMHDAPEQIWSKSDGASSALCRQRVLKALGQSPGRTVGRACLPEHIQAAFDEELWSGPHSNKLRASSVIIGLHPDQATDFIVDFAVKTGKPFAVVPCCVFPRLFRHRRLFTDDCEAMLSIRAEDGSLPARSAGDSHQKLKYKCNSSLPIQTLGHMHDKPKYSDPSMSPFEEPESDGPWLGSHAMSQSHLLEDEQQELDAKTGIEGEAVVTHEQLLIYLQRKGGPTACTTRIPFQGINAVVYRLPEWREPCL